MSGENKTILAFDAYGTLLSTESIAKKLASHFGQEKAQTIATTWRKYQLEYTWRLNSMNIYEDFSKVTLRSLRHALAESSVSLEQKDIDDLMKAYDSLSIFPDVGPALEAIAKQSDLYPVVFSNGTHTMVSNSVNKSPDLSKHASAFKDIVVVEEPKRFKPTPESYAHLAKAVGKNPNNKEDMASMWLISGNPFDITGARAVGMQACWVDRAGNGWQDAMIEGELGRPSAIVSSLEEVPNAVSGFLPVQ
ncbi:haloacid dehalogenase, type II [Aureobasidium subglaciale]|nr:haloacid dehalogenase, type II [Aureobasidium subglaciale]KAI5232413.1 haloacid dehalogenase, type II [Aureobasidium subglaciale]KAI5234887.1 haloacid dehalogenase, type II [Aureobasidium subglaciale]KAI5268521.1 haloacid dehalogenase, type II [Aureobasidium subglaciale]